MGMESLSLVLALFGSFYAFPSAGHQSTRQQERKLFNHNTCLLNTNELNVAIVGSGIAGTSAAHFLSQISAHSYFGPQRQRPVHITVYEQQANVGGSLLTIYPPSTDLPLDAGCPEFSPQDWCISELINAASMRTRPTSFSPYIWDGAGVLPDEVCYPVLPPIRVTDRVFSYLRKLRACLVTWWTGHGSAVHSFRRAREQVWKEWQLFLGQSSLDGGDGSWQQELERITKQNSSQVLEGIGVDQDFQANAIEPCVRGMFGRNLDDVSGLIPFLATSNPGCPPISIRGGNQGLAIRLLEELIQRARVAVHLKSRVTGLEQTGQSRWRLQFSTDSSPKDAKEDFDAIIFTGPSYKSTGQSDDGSEPIEYFDIHVTHFSTHAWLAFGLPHDSLTTCSEATDLPDRGILRIATHPEFYIDKEGCWDDDECDQFVHVYRIDSHERL